MARPAAHPLEGGKGPGGGGPGAAQGPVGLLAMGTTGYDEAGARRFLVERLLFMDQQAVSECLPITKGIAREDGYGGCDLSCAERCERSRPNLRSSTSDARLGSGHDATGAPISVVVRVIPRSQGRGHDEPQGFNSADTS